MFWSVFLRNLSVTPPSRGIFSFKISACLKILKWRLAHIPLDLPPVTDSNKRVHLWLLYWLAPYLPSPSLCIKNNVQPTLLKPFHHSRMARWLLQSLWPIKVHWSQAFQTYQGDEPFAKGRIHSEGFEWSLRLFISYKSWWILILQIRKQHCWVLQWTTCSRTIGSCKRSSSTSSNLNLWMPNISHFESSVWGICLLFVIQTRII